MDRKRRKGRDDREVWQIEDMLRLRQLWEKRPAGLTKAAVADKMGVTGSMISQFFSGDSALTWKAVVAFSSLFGVAPEEISPRLTAENMPHSLSGGDVHDDLSSAKSGDALALPGPDIVAAYPLLGSVPGGDFREAVELAREDPSVRWIPSPKKLPGPGFFLRVSGSSMSPTLMDGDIILVDPDAQAHHKSVVVVRNGSGEATVKRLIMDGESLMLVPDNPQFPAKPIDDCGLVGVVVCAYKEL